MGWVAQDDKRVGVRVGIDVLRGVERVLWVGWGRMISVWDAWVG